MSERTRRYCWRVGGTVVLARGEKCPECGSDNHPDLEDQGQCGRFVACGDTSHGHPCEMSVGHGGVCGFFDDGSCAGQRKGLEG